jgi:hypothetical protein
MERAALKEFGTSGFIFSWIAREDHAGYIKIIHKQASILVACCLPLD